MRARRGVALGAQEAQHRERGGQHEQPVGARLLRVPHEQRVDRHERRAARSPRAGPRARGRSPRRRAPWRCRRARRAAAARPRRCRATRESTHCEQVPERRAVLGVDDRAQRGPEARVQHVHGRERLVVPEALQVERGEAQHRGEQRERRQRPPARQAAASRRPCRAGAAARLARPRSSRAHPARRRRRSSRSGRRAGLRSAAAGTSRRARCAVRQPTGPQITRQIWVLAFGGPGLVLPQTTSRSLRRAEQFLVDCEVVVGVAGVGAPGAQVGDQALVDARLADDVVDRRDREQHARRARAASSRSAACCPVPGCSASRGRSHAGSQPQRPARHRRRRGVAGPRSLHGRQQRRDLVDDEQRLDDERRRQQPPVARRSTASGSGQRMYQASSQVLVTEIASSVQPEAAIQS